VPAKPRTILTNHFAAVAFLAFFWASASLAQSSDALLPLPKPADVPKEWKSWIGDYGPDDNVQTIFERGQRLWLYEKGGGEWQLKQIAKEDFQVPPSDKNPVMDVGFSQDGSELALNDVRFSRRDYGVDKSQTARMQPLHPVSQLRASALAASPPKEIGPFRQADLVELAPLDASIHLDIRYATSNDFLGTPVYSQARAFLQRPAAEALLRVHKNSSRSAMVF
jgi:hypothetical protein